MTVELPGVWTAVAFIGVIGVAVIGLLAMPIGMTTGTVLMMVVPSMVVFGAIMLAIGIGYGRHQAKS